MNSIVRNFIFVISRFKMASFLNVAGLSVAFTAFLILFMQIRYEWGYDRFHKHADRLYRLEIVFNNTGAQVVLNRPLIDRFLGLLSAYRGGSVDQSVGRQDIYHGGSGR